jgi:hypothetical protein
VLDEYDPGVFFEGSSAHFPPIKNGSPRAENDSAPAESDSAPAAFGRQWGNRPPQGHAAPRFNSGFFFNIFKFCIVPDTSHHPLGELFRLLLI